jgi:zinc/manganese transport system ATP-binding protein
MSGPGGATIALRAATLRYGHYLIWNDLDLDVAPGERLAVPGPDRRGQGHATQGALGLIPLSAGAVIINGRPPTRGSPQ